MRKVSAGRAAALLLSLACLGSPAAGHGSELEASLIVSSETVAPGEASRLTLLIVNPTERAIPVRLEPDLSCRLDSPEGTFALHLEALPSPDDAPIALAPAGTLRHEYAFTVPEDARGPFAFGCESVGAPPTVLRVEAKSGESGLLRQRFQEFAAAFGAYDPLYFVVGVDPGESKFQISFEYQVLNPEAPLARRFPWATGFHLAYTQTSLWDLKSESAPFKDTSYKPEVHFLSPEIPWRVPWFDPLRIRLGLQHESNGKDGPDSRSTNFAYLTPVVAVDLGARWGLELAPKAWLYVNNDDRTNRHLPDYRGYFDLEVNLARVHGMQLSTHLRWARAGGTVQLDFTYPLTRVLHDNFDLYLQAQYFNGYAETLLSFDDHNQMFRIGLALLR